MAYTTIDDPTAFFQTVLYTGNGATGRSITLPSDTDMQPDWVWLKSRGEAEHHQLTDSVRGVNKQIYSHLAYAEATETDRISAFNSDGFTIEDDIIVNKNNIAFVAWCWKAGTTGSGNTTGSGTAKAYSYSVNTTAGFSIVKYVGNQTDGHTIPHHLGAKPDMILVKHRDDGQQWASFWAPLGATKVMRFATTNAVSDSNTRWSDTEPSSTVFTLGNEHEVNTNDGNHIAYCFTSIKGYSKIGSYTGNGNADGPFVFLGFKPAWIMVKCTTDAGYNWVIYDNKRVGFNPDNDTLTANETRVEQTTGFGHIDIVSNGFKVRASTNDTNRNANEIIYMAFAESPFVNSNKVPNNAR